MIETILSLIDTPDLIRNHKSQDPFDKILFKSEAETNLKSISS